MQFRPWLALLLALVILGCCCAVGVAQEGESAASAEESASTSEAAASTSAGAESTSESTASTSAGAASTSAGAASQDQALTADLASPRDTMRTLLKSVNQDNLTRAATTLDFSEIQPPPSAARRELLALRLKEIIDRIVYVEYTELPEQTNEQEFVYAEDASDFPLVLVRGQDDLWRFSPQTVAQIGPRYQEFAALPVVEAPWWRRFHIGDNELWHIGALFAALLVSWIVGRIVEWILQRSGNVLERRGRVLGASMLGALGRAAVPIALVIGLSVGLKFLVLNTVVRQTADVIVSILATLAVAYALWCLVSVVERWLGSMAQKTSSKLDDMLVPMVRTTLKATIVIMALVQVATILSNKPVTSVIAGLGIGGLAIGLAAQDTVKNFFGSIMLFSDRPFEMGERIQVQGFDGTIESVGFRSTRLRTLDGHLVTIPNGTLANDSIRNVAKRPNIRRIMNLGLTYDTPPEKVQRAKAIVEELLADHEGMDPELPPKVYFTDFMDSSLNLFVIYWYHPPDWWAYNDFSEKLNMEILTRFNAEGIEFAFPSQTLYLAGDPSRPLNLGGPVGEG